MRTSARAITALLMLSGWTTLAHGQIAFPVYARGNFYCSAHLSGLAPPDTCFGYGPELQLFDDGLHDDDGVGDGIYGVAVTCNQPGGMLDFKIANSDWSFALPTVPGLSLINGRVFTSGPGDVVHFRLDTRIPDYGWVPQISVANDHGYPADSTLELIGSPPELGAWVTGLPATRVGDIWRRTVTIADPGSYSYKFRVAGFANFGLDYNDNFGRDVPFTTTHPNTEMQFEFDERSGRLRAIPTGPLLLTDSTLAFNVVTAGDTLREPLKLQNGGNQTLTITQLEPGSPAISISPRTPIDIPPGGSAALLVTFAPVATERSDVAIIIHSNDARDSLTFVHMTTFVQPLTAQTRALSTSDPYPLGEALVMQCVPDDGVHMTGAVLHYKSAGLADYQSARLQPFAGGTFITLISGDFVREGGLKYYVEIENNAVTVLDPPGAPGRPYTVDVASPGGFQINPANTGIGFRRRGDSINFTMFLERGTVFDVGTLHYRAGGETVFKTTPIVAITFTGYAASIPGFEVGPRGIEYWAEVRTLTRTLTVPPSMPAESPQLIPIVVDTLTEPAVHPGGRYRLVSVPLEMPSSTTLRSVLSDQTVFGLLDPVRWRAFRYDPAVPGNVELSDATASQFDLQPGKAFWLITRDEHRVDSAPVPGQSTSTSGGVSLTLAPGWNLVGDPYDFAVAWRNVQFSGTVGPPVAFDPSLGGTGAYSPDTPTRLEPFDGYFIENLTGTPQTMLVPPIEDAAVPARAASAAPMASLPSGPGAWSLRLEARTDHAVDVTGRAGVDPRAADEYDALDRREPPPAPGPWVRFAIANPGWSSYPGSYARDVRSAAAPGHTWPIEVRSTAKGEIVTLTLAPEAMPPDSVTLRLVDVEQGSVVDFPADRGAPLVYRVISRGPETPYRLQLVAGSGGYVSGTVDGARVVPGRLELEQCVPNPLSGPGKIRFGLPVAAPVELAIFDVGGRRLATLIDGEMMSAGFHTAIWDGLLGDRRASNGIYYYRLASGSSRVTKRLVVQR